jgi:hypothetical protein
VRRRDEGARIYSLYGICVDKTKDEKRERDRAPLLASIMKTSFEANQFGDKKEYKAPESGLFDI